MSDVGDELEAQARQRLGSVLRGKYRLDALLGIGGMAVVYKATHRNQAEFAVKMLHPELGLHQSVRQRFLREGYAANSVKHPGAVSVVDDDVTEDGTAFLVMELLDGVEVEKYWTESGHRLAPFEASSIVFQLLDVLAAAHAKGIIHRDIKPANLFLTRDGTVKVLDFGIARARDVLSGPHATGSGVLLGTPAFMSPEQVLGKTSEIDGQADVWSAGATLFTLISGHDVHEAETAAHIMVKAATEPARPLRLVAPDVPPPIAEVVDRALAVSKAERWPSAVAMRDALDAACRASFARGPAKIPLGSPDAATSYRLAQPVPSGNPVDVQSATVLAAASPTGPSARSSVSRTVPSVTAQPISSEVPVLARPAEGGSVLKLVAAAASVGALLVVAVIKLVRPGLPAESSQATQFGAPAATQPASSSMASSASSASSAASALTPAAPTPPLTGQPSPAAPKASAAPPAPPRPAARGKANPLDLPFK
jgi:serine/threonine-protein kinase